MGEGLPPRRDLLALIDEAAVWVARDTTPWRDEHGSFGTVASSGTYGNTVTRVRVPAVELDAFLADIGTRYPRPPAFHVGPFETPGLAEALLSAGYLLAERDGILVHDLDQRWIPDAGGIEVREALDVDDFLAENWLSVVVFGDPPVGKKRARSEARRAHERGDQLSRTFIVPDPRGTLSCLASAGMAFYGSWAFLVSGQTHPDARGQGLYRALVSKRLRVAREIGLAFAATEADEATSYPILMRLGFRCIGWKEIYRWPGGVDPVSSWGRGSRGTGQGLR